MSKLYKQFKASVQQMAVCSVTGIAIKLEVPAIPNKVFSYDSPLSRIDNALGIAQLSLTDKSNVPKPVLSGAILTLLSAYKLVEDPLSAVERNELLSNCSVHLLHSFLHLFVSNSKAKIYSFPHFSFASLLQKEAAAFTVTATVQESIKAYVEACTTRIPSTSVTVARTVKLAKEKRIKTVSPALRSQMKALINSIHEDGLVNSKVLGILLLVSQKNNLYTMNPTIRLKLVTKLQSLDSIAATDLAKIIKDAAINSEEVEIEKHFDASPKRSLAEILAAKINGSDKINKEEASELFGQIEAAARSEGAHSDESPNNDDEFPNNNNSSNNDDSNDDPFHNLISHTLTSPAGSSPELSIADEIRALAEEVDEDEELLGDPDEYSEEEEKEEGDDYANQF